MALVLWGLQGPMEFGALLQHLCVAIGTLTGYMGVTQVGAMLGAVGLGVPSMIMWLGSGRTRAGLIAVLAIGTLAH